MTRVLVKLICYKGSTEHITYFSSILSIYSKQHQPPIHFVCAIPLRLIDFDCTHLIY